ncbi:MAG: hypothetical protein UY86_C0008G0002 [Candidatus Adlerbacteria bacterium GW2011_GWB1_54_7]|uniref:Uncharacterized protein n=1 Tax=Candidatus Adlerbacteria bacterium GW2011_GWB1_54_7 TaxID=1618607 RepID=A0A0G1Y2Q0_9BACT|nr:MAG: hypothetical protein UY86_C0008G0002 [Candidatus Adlerbacteria bacterium GW2011_GWB1_54_7]
MKNRKLILGVAVFALLVSAGFFALPGDAMQMTGFPLDIVQLEKIEPEFAEIILSKGKIIYERL